MPMTPAPRHDNQIDGKRAFYHYLQKELQQRDPELFRTVVRQLVSGLSVWLPHGLMAGLPVVLPFALRDRTARANIRRGTPELWGSPNIDGYFRDDNTLVKQLPRSLLISSSSNSSYNGRTIRKGFVASHIWRQLRNSSAAAANPWVNSFAPNLVWLPSQLAELSDREGSYVQRYLQAVSLKFYRQAPVPHPLAVRVEQVWSELPSPVDIDEADLPSIEELSVFQVTDRWMSRRRDTLRRVVRGMEAVLAGLPLGRKVISTRYTDGLPLVERARLERTAESLATYLNSLA